MYSDPYGLYANFVVGVGIRVVGGRAAGAAIANGLRGAVGPTAGTVLACVLTGYCSSSNSSNGSGTTPGTVGGSGGGTGSPQCPPNDPLCLNQQQQNQQCPRYNGPKPQYHVNNAHVPGQRGFNPKKTPLPNNAQQVYQNAVPNHPTNPTAWFGKAPNGQIYRYSLTGNGQAHFSGIRGVGSGTRNFTQYAARRLGVKYR